MRLREAHHVAVVDFATLVVLAIMFVVLLRSKPSQRGAHLMGALILGSVLANVVVSELIRGRAIDIAYVPFVMIAAGAVLLSPVIFAVALAITLAICIATLALVVPSGNSTTTTVGLVAGLVISISVFESRRRSHQRISALRERDREQARSLREALLHLEEKFREHQDMQAKRQELEDQLRQAQKLEAIGVLAGGVAHDMNNVLGAITTVASLAVDRVKADESLRQDLTDILSAARRGSALTRNLLGFARQGTHVRDRFQLGDTVLSVIRLMRSSISKQIELAYCIDPELDDVVGDAGQMSHALMNLCINGVDAISGAGKLDVTVRNCVIDSAQASKLEVEPGRHVELRVTDTGCGIAPELMARVFEPFFSTKPRNERSGLGLSMVYGTVKECGGTVSIRSKVGHGTSVAVLLPSVLAQRVAQRPASAHPPEHSEHRRHILLVDDEPMLRSAGKRLISSMGFEVITAGNGAEAAASYRQYHDQIALVILDVAMPVMSGVECFKRLRQIDPDACVLIASGYARHGDVDALLSAGAVGYLGKPYDRRELQNAIRHALNMAHSASMVVAHAIPPMNSDVTRVSPDEEPAHRLSH